MDAVRIAVRMRTKRYAENESYLGEFTIRTERFSGAKTELRKILSGFGDFMFYGFEHPDGERLGRWTLIDLNAFREAFSEMQYKSPAGVMPGNKRINGDGSSAFVPFRFSDFPPELVVASGVGIDCFQTEGVANAG
jgi:hypothetical protein